MNKLKVLIAVTLIMAAFWSCDNDLELIEEWQNIPVVYGLLDKTEVDHYIRVEKVFVDPETSGIQLAQNPDSLYYDDNVSVEIERVATGDRVVLSRVDGSTVGFPREDGFFATTPNILYHFSDTDLPLVTNESYRLIVRDGATDAIITEATTDIVGVFEHLNNRPKNPINWKSTREISVGWSSNLTDSDDKDETAFIYDVRMRMYYEEFDVNNPSEVVEKELLWVPAQNILREEASSTTTVKIAGREFFTFLANNIEASPNLARQFRHIDILIDAGGKEIYDYVNIGQANTGITSAQEIPSYTNLSEGIGLFSSRSRTVFPMFNIDSEARDSLREGSITAELNFVN